MTNVSLLTYLSKNNRKWQRHVLFHSNSITNGNFYNRAIFSEAHDLLKEENMTALEASNNPLIHVLKPDIQSYYESKQLASEMVITEPFWAGVLYGNKQEWVEKFVKLYNNATDVEKQQIQWFFSYATPEIQQKCGIDKQVKALNNTIYSQKELDLFWSSSDMELRYHTILKLGDIHQKNVLKSSDGHRSFLIGYYANEELPSYFHEIFTLDIVQAHAVKYGGYFKTYYPVLFARLTGPRWTHEVAHDLLLYRETFREHDKMYEEYIHYVAHSTDIPFILRDFEYLWNKVKKIEDFKKLMPHIQTPDVREAFIEKVFFNTVFNAKDITYENLEILADIFHQNVDLCYKKVGNMNRDLIVILEFFTEKPEKKALQYFLSKNIPFKQEKFVNLNIDWDNLRFEGLPGFMFLQQVSPRHFPLEEPVLTFEETELWI